MTVNKNVIPYDTTSPAVTSGIRLGTPALTTRGMKEDDMRRVAAWMNQVLNNPENPELHQKIAQEVAEFCSAFPLHKKE
jgi:glycine hydroxymethyltransferase